MLNSWSEFGGVNVSVGVLEITLACTVFEESITVPSKPFASGGLLIVHFLKWVLMLLLWENLRPQFGQE